MKLIYFKRRRRGYHIDNIHGHSYANCFYAPNENIVLFKEQQGTFGGKHYSISNDEKFLEEVRDALSNPEKYQDKTMPNGTKISEDITYSNIKEIECDDSMVRQLIQEIKSAKESERKVQTGIENLLKQVE